jgi:outer membrane receptor protein involved in Fe transport
VPTIQNIVQSDNGGIKPEIIREMQFQLGYYNKNFEISSTIFYNKLDGLIVFLVDSLQNESYKNRGKMNTRGIETEMKWKIGKLKISANHSFYQPFNSTSIDVLIDDSNEKLGTFSFPLHKLYFGFSYQLNKDVSINIFETFLSKKTIVPSKITIHNSGAIVLKNENNINVTCQIQNLFDNKLKLNFGIYNVLNTKNYYGYAYKSGYQPMIGMGRELFFQLKYSL